MSSEEEVEVLAALAHEQWAGWMEYLFSKCDEGPFVGGYLIIPPWAVERWRRQMLTPYAELSYEEQESDRVEARKVLDRIATLRKEAVDDGEQVRHNARQEG